MHFPFLSRLVHLKHFLFCYCFLQSFLGFLGWIFVVGFWWVLLVAPSVLLLTNGAMICQCSPLIKRKGITYFTCARSWASCYSSFACFPFFVSISYPTREYPDRDLVTKLPSDIFLWGVGGGPFPGGVGQGLTAHSL